GRARRPRRARPPGTTPWPPRCGVSARAAPDPIDLPRGHPMLPSILATVMTVLVPGGDVPRLRQPTALCLSRDGTRLYAANGRSGSLCVVDPRAARVVSEHDVGRALVDAALLADGRH